ncbi:MAG: asparagine--tRNA ligase [Candidatus Absconditabacterales bacterium]
MFVTKEIGEEFLGKEIQLGGWINHIRSSGKIAFVELRYGMGFIQLIIEKNNIGDNKFDELTACGIETSLIIKGSVCKHPKKEEYEIQVKELNIITKTNDYPIGQKEHGPEFLLDNRHLRLRSDKQRAIQRIRNTIIYANYDWLRNNNFIKIDAPIFTPTACEGTSNLYEVKHVNGESMYLSQSGQLYIEAAMMAHGRVFDFGPTFRAEKSKTRRHLNEFWMMDAEMAFVGHEGNLEIQENLIYYIIQEVLKLNQNELKILERDIVPLQKIKVPFIRKDYEDVIKELNKLGSDIKSGDDLGADDETILMNKYENCLFVEKYPKHVKAFYMKEDPKDKNYVLNADLLAPEGCGEIIGGSERESDYQKLLDRIKEEKLPVEYFNRYLDLRKYGGVPHSGFGFGLERLVRWICNLHHIRESIPFPRYANRITP